MVTEAELKELQAKADLAETLYIETDTLLTRLRILEQETRANFLAARLAVLHAQVPEVTNEMLASLESVTESIQSLSDDLKNMATTNSETSKGDGRAGTQEALAQSK